MIREWEKENHSRKPRASVPCVSLVILASCALLVEIFLCDCAAGRHCALRTFRRVWYFVNVDRLQRDKRRLNGMATDSLMQLLEFKNVCCCCCRRRGIFQPCMRQNKFLERARGCLGVYTYGALLVIVVRMRMQLNSIHQTSIFPEHTLCALEQLEIYRPSIMAKPEEPAVEEAIPRLPMPSRNPLPLSTAQESQVRELYHKRVRAYCAPEIKGMDSFLFE